MALTKISRSLLDTGVSDSSDATAITIDSSENVGIGTTSGDVRSDGNANRTYVSIIGNANRGVLNLGSTASAGADGGKLTFVNGTNAVGEIYVDPDSGSQTNGFMVFSTSNSERMRIDSSGNVGIGTTSPARGPLHLATSGSDYCQLHMTNGTSGSTSSDGLTLFTNGTDTGLMQRENSYLLFGTNDTERVRIDSSGNFLIGTSTTRTGTASLSLEPSNSYILFRQTGAQSLAQIQFMRNTDSTATYAGGISTTGTTVTYSTSSDYRLKENINYNFDALDRVKQLKPARFNFITDADTTVDGFIAHEVSNIVPEAITGEKDGEEMQGIDQSKLVPLLTKAIQELSAKVEELESRINE